MHKKDKKARTEKTNLNEFKKEEQILLEKANE